MLNNLLLIKACLKGKREAQLELYNQYAPNMLGVCYRYTKSIEDAEDILQEAFIKVFNNLHQYKQEGDLGAWIRRIIVNCAITYLRKHNRYKKDLQLEDITMHPVTDENPEIKIDTKQLVDLIRNLPTGYQTIFNLVAVEGFNHIEVAALLNININTVRSHYSRARNLLITALKKNEKPLQQISYAGRI